MSYNHLNDNKKLDIHLLFLIYWSIFFIWIANAILFNFWCVMYKIVSNELFVISRDILTPTFSLLVLFVLLGTYTFRVVSLFNSTYHPVEHCTCVSPILVFLIMDTFTTLCMNHLINIDKLIRYIYSYFIWSINEFEEQSV